MSLRVKFWLILGLAVVAAILAYPREDKVLKFLHLGKNPKLSVRQGLDLQGGAHLVFQADLSKTKTSERSSAMDSLVLVMQKRLNPAGTNEVVIQRQGASQVGVDVPKTVDASSAIDLLSRTANLVFLESTTPSNPNNIQETGITGKDVDQATVDFDTQTNQPIVTLTLKGAAINKFSDITTGLHNSGGTLTTLLDNQVVFGPATVSSPITDGHAQLQGNFKTVADAKKVADEITAGALPVPVSLVEQNTVGPTLGQESIARSIVAGIIGLVIVALFMVAYYRLAGLLAVGALFIYTLLTLTIYKLSALTPYTITLTLAGTAGFILSIGMAVDANILIFERMKEELRSGKSFVSAVEAGFDRAWPSIRDSNTSTLITCFILYVFSGASPVIKGFAVTLGLGVIISMFTAVVVTRTFLRMIIRFKFGRQPSWYGLRLEGEKA